MLKLILIISFLISVESHAKLSCDVLFEIDPNKSHIFDDYMPFESSFESKLRMEALTGTRKGYSKPTAQKNYDLTTAIRRLREATELVADYYTMSESILKLSDKIRTIGLENMHWNYSKSNSLRFKEMELGVMYRTMDVLDAMGVKYLLLSDNRVWISTEGHHYLNKVAYRLKSRDSVLIYISVRGLVDYNAGGMYYPGEKKILLSPKALLEKSIFQYGVGLHEFTHHLDLQSKKVEHPYQVSIDVEKSGKVEAESLGIYKRGFSLDELRAYRISIKTLTHNNITQPQDFATKFVLDKIKVYSDLMATMSSISIRVLSAYLNGKDSDSYSLNIKTVKISESEIYLIDKLPRELAVETLEYVQYMEKFFGLISKKTQEVSGQSKENRAALIRKINRVMSIPEIRKMEGNYPALEEIEAMLN